MDTYAKWFICRIKKRCQDDGQCGHHPDIIHYRIMTASPLSLKMEYVPAGESGPDHHKKYTVNVLVNGKVMGKGVGSSKKRAEQNAAYEALKAMNRD